MTVTAWLRLLNRKVFFWVSEHRVNELLAAQHYRDREHIVLVVDTAALVTAHEPAITLSAINTGATLYNPPPRGSDTLLPVVDYPFEHWRRVRRTPRKAVAELAGSRSPCSARRGVRTRVDESVAYSGLPGECVIAGPEIA